jgi:hypothetical protein
MSTPQLPDHPDLDQLRRRARELQRGARAGSEEALDLLRRHLGPLPAAGVPLHLAQLALARGYGFSSWPRLVGQLRAAAAATRDPLAAPLATDGPLEDLLRYAVLRFGPDDGPGRWRAAAVVLRAHPELPTRSVHAAAATGDLDALRHHLTRDRRLASDQGGPFRWPPVLYLACSRLGLVQPGGDPVGALDLLLDSGADPAAGYLWQGLPTPVTALAGVLGGGEAEQPPHPDGDLLARRLLAAGADANDGQALYNRMFSDDDSHLVLLLERGLGHGDGGRWRRRLPDLTDSPGDLMATQLAWATVHGLESRVRLLAAGGLDLDRPLGGRLPVLPGATAVQLARRVGRPEMVRLLVELGARDVDPDPEGHLAERLLVGDDAGVDRLLAAGPGGLERLRATHPSLVLRAAVADQPAGVRLLVARGFAVDALGRQDLPVEQPWETALHHAAGEGKDDLVRLLLALGADPEVRDRRFGATPLGWARHFARPGSVTLLEPVSPAG